MVIIEIHGSGGVRGSSLLPDIQEAIKYITNNIPVMIEEVNSICYKSEGRIPCSQYIRVCGADERFVRSVTKLLVDNISIVRAVTNIQYLLIDQNYTST